MKIHQGSLLYYRAPEPKRSRHAVVLPRVVVKTPSKDHKIACETVEISYQCLKFWAVFYRMPGGDNLFLDSLGHLFDSCVQNLNNLSIGCHE